MSQELGIAKLKLEKIGGRSNKLLTPTFYFLLVLECLLHLDSLEGFDDVACLDIIAADK